MARLTQALGEGLPTAKAAAAPEAERIEWDDQLKGFGLRLYTSGRRSWLVQYRAGGRQRRISLGDATVVMAAEARARARELLAQSDLGRDPQAERQAARRTLTVKQLVELYLEHQARPRLKPRSLIEVERHLSTKGKVLHPLAAGAVARADVARVLQRIATTAPVQANRVRASLTAMFTWAVAHGLVHENPVAGTVRPTSEKPRSRVLSPDELALVWREAGDSAHGQVVKLILLTAARRAEAGGMHSREVDNGWLWTVPAERSKNGQPIERLLPVAARELLQARLAAADGAEAVGARKNPSGEDAPLFATTPADGGRPGDGFHGWSRAKARLDRRIATARLAARQAPLADWTLHDLRRSVATALGELGLAAPHVVETLLGHRHERVGSAHAVYNRATYRAETGRALAGWAEHLMALVEGREPAGGVVVALTGRAG